MRPSAAARRHASGPVSYTHLDVYKRQVDSRLMEASLKRLVSAIDAPEGALAVYNFGPEVKAEVVEFYYEGGWPVVYDGERKVSVQKSGERTYIFTASGLPERGYKTLSLIHI